MPRGTAYLLPHYTRTLSCF